MVAPPGLTPEEAEEGARRMYELSLKLSKSDLGGLEAFLPPWEKMEPRHRENWRELYRFAHSEGAKAAKAEVAEFFRRHGSILQDLCWSTAADCEHAASSGGIGNMVEPTKNYRALADEIAALAAELETGKA